MLRWLIGIILGKIICKSSNWQHIQRLKITILGANWQLFRLERIASYLILSTQNIKFYWFVMKITKYLLPIWWYNRGSFPLRNEYFGVFVLNGLTEHLWRVKEPFWLSSHNICYHIIFFKLSDLWVKWYFTSGFHICHHFKAIVYCWWIWRNFHHSTF